MTTEQKQPQQQEEDTGYWTYCGYVCSAELEKQQEIVDELIELSKRNREFATIMLGRLMDKLNSVRLELGTKETNTNE